MLSPFRRLPRAARVALTVSASTWLAACATSAPAGKPADSTQQVNAPTSVSAPKPTYGSFGVDLSAMDRSVAPGDDFYRYVNGTWVQKTEIPPDRANYGILTALEEASNQRTREILEEAARSDAPPGSDTRKLGDLFNSFMDEAAIETRGVAPLQPEFERINAISNRKELSSALGDTLRADVDVLNTDRSTTDRLFGVWVTQDLNDPSRYLPYVLQGGLGLPDRDYYLSSDAKLADIRQKYQQHIANMLRLAGLSNPEARASGIFELERKIAQAHWPHLDTEDITKTNNPWPRDEFAKRAPGMDWDAYFEAAGLGPQRDFGVWQPSALTGISRLVGSEPIQTWKDYLTFHVIARAAPFLSKAFVDESFAFNGRVLLGTQKQRERWKRAMYIASDEMGDAVGKLYVAKYFPPETRAEAEKMVRNIVAALGEHIDSLAWMAPETKARAKEKLATLHIGIGYPTKWRDYSGLEIVRGDAYGNAYRASRHESRRNLNKLGKPVDRTEWFMVPQLVNAMNSPQENAIFFPAAILQPPYFDPHADPAVNYGGIGSVIGHEVVHNFDDVGAQFDAQGKLANWWTPRDAAQFKAAGQALAAQYNAYRPLPDLAVNGELTLGENIADVAGLSIAYDGYKRSLAGKAAPVLDGFTGDQRFFLGFAQMERNKYREALLRRVLLTDVHAPSEYRAQTVRNVDAWYPAFGVKPGQALYLEPPQRVRVW